MAKSSAAVHVAGVALVQLRYHLRMCQRAMELCLNRIVVAIGDQPLCLCLLQFGDDFAAGLGRDKLGFWWIWSLGKCCASSGEEDKSGCELLGVHGKSP